MKNHVKTSHGIAILAACFLLALFLINQMEKQSGVVSEAASPASQVAQVSQTATLVLSPSSSSVLVGNTFTVSILLNTGGNGTYGVDINKLRFNPSILQVVDADGVAAGVQIAAGSLMGSTVINSVDNVAGTIQFSQLANPPTTFNGSGTLATITFQVIGAGISGLSFDFTLNSGTDCNVAGLGGDMLSGVTNGTYTATAPDVTPPTISSIVSSGVTVSGATITWTTNENSDSQVQYGLTTGYGTQTALNSSLVTSHTATLSGLSPSTTYHYRVLSRDAAGNLATSGDNTFTTPAPPDTTPPTISALSVSAITASGATVSWTTNENSDTQVQYGLTTGYGSQTTLNSSLVTAHSAALSGLSAGTLYHYRVLSRDAAGNLATSGDNSFTTQTLPDTTAPTVPNGFTATPTSETQIQLSWNASTDPTGTGQAVAGVAGYQIWRGATQVGTSVSTSYLDTGLTAGTLYTYQVAAYDAATPANVSAKTLTLSTTTPIASLNVQRTIQIVLEGAPSNLRAASGTIEFLDPSTSLKIYQANISANSSGQYLLNVPSGLLPTVTMRLKILGYLSKLVSAVDLRNVTVLTVTFPTSPAGDFNGDQLINSLDFSYMNGKWSTNDSLADVDRNGLVNALDFSYLSNNWLLAGQ